MPRETAPRFAGMGGHHRAKPGTVEWLTPPEIITALGPFDLDPCAPAEQPYPTAQRTFTRLDNGLTRRWKGRVWLNPPYTSGEIALWLARLAEHDHGTALIFARTETDAFFRHVWERAAALLFMRGRLNFHLPDGSRARGNAGAPTVLCAYGATDADILAAAEIDGPLRAADLPALRAGGGAARRDLVRGRLRRARIARRPGARRGRLAHRQGPPEGGREGARPREG